jgi:hypothetical protein
LRRINAANGAAWEAEVYDELLKQYSSDKYEIWRNKAIREPE